MEQLHRAGITENMLQEIIANGATTSPISNDAPTYGILIELYHFSHSVAKALKCRPNRVLKLLVDSLFPHCVVSRADRLERRIQAIYLSVERLSKDEIPEYLCRQWMPQPTGIIS